MSELTLEEKIEKVRHMVSTGLPVYMACQSAGLELATWYRKRHVCSNCMKLEQELKTVKKKKADLLAYIKQLF